MNRVPPRISSLVGASVLLALSFGTARGQAARILPVEDPAYVWIARLQDRGLLAPLLPGALPYLVADVRDAIRHDREAVSDPLALRWLALVEERLESGPLPGSVVVGFSADPGVGVSTSRRMDPLRPLGSRVNAYPHALFTAWAASDRITAEVSARVDAYYDRDPDGLDAALRAFSRSENSYVGYAGRGIALHLGRFSTHWGLPGSPAMLLSGNPRTIDAIRLRLGSGRLSLSSFFGELDAMTGDGRFTGTAGDDSVRSGAEGRWLAAHRLDWRPNPDLLVTFSEAVLFSGRGTGWSLKYLNPLQPALLETDNRPKNEENNGMVALSIHARRGPLSGHAQLVVDDFDLMHLDERASLAGTLRIVRAGITPAADAGFGVTAVAARTYDTFQPEGRWIHLGRGIATQFSDFVEAHAFLRWYAESIGAGWVVEPRLTMLWQGERDLRDPYGPDDTFGTILTGVVERTARAAVRIGFEPSSRVALHVDAGVNHVSDLGHAPGTSRLRASVTGAVSLRLLSTRSGIDGF